MKLLDRLIDRRIAAYQRELIEIHYAEVENMYRQARGWRHDYRSHIQMMKVLAAQGDLDGIRGYLDELETDLTTLDAVVKTKRLIRVYIDRKGNQLYISCTNFTATGKRDKHEGRFRTTKGEGHGFGLVRMDAIVDRLGGYLSRNSEDGAFTTEILLPVG